MFKRIEYKETAKKIYKNNLFKSIIIGSILWFFDNDIIQEIADFSMTIGKTQDLFVVMGNPILKNLSFLSFNTLLIIFIVVYIILSPVSTIAMNYYKDLSLGIDNPNIFSIFKKGLYLKIAALIILTSIITTLGFCLLLFPGLYLMYGLRYVGLIAMDNPTLSIPEILKESMRITNGYKLDLFGLDFSFIGWLLLIAFLGAISFEFFIVIGGLFIMPYIALADVEAYKQLVINNQKF